MASNSSASTFCSVDHAISDWFLLTYTILPPIYFPLGVLGHIIALIIYYNQAKTEKAYAYQILFSIVKILDTTSAGLLGLCKLLTDNSSRFRLSYLTVDTFVAQAHPYVTFLASYFLTLSIMSLAAMAVDRALALCKPMLYRNMTHRLHQTVALTLCCAISFVSSIQYALENAVISKGVYAVKPPPYMVTVKPILTELRAVTREISFVVMLLGNLVMVWLYRRRNRKVIALSNQSDVKSKKNERMLFLLVLSQCTLNGISTTVGFAYSFTATARPNEIYCEMLLFSYINFAVGKILDILDVAVALAINSHFRRWVMKLRSRGATSRGDGTVTSRITNGTRNMGPETSIKMTLCSQSIQATLTNVA